jgi:hypothetical protein
MKIIVLYLAAFGLALRFFLSGKHVLAYLLMVTAFLLLVGYAIRSDLQAKEGRR